MSQESNSNIQAIVRPLQENASGGLLAERWKELKTSILENIGKLKEESEAKKNFEMSDGRSLTVNFADNKLYFSLRNEDRGLATEIYEIENGEILAFKGDVLFRQYKKPELGAMEEINKYLLTGEIDVNNSEIVKRLGEKAIPTEDRELWTKAAEMSIMTDMAEIFKTSDEMKKEPLAAVADYQLSEGLVLRARLRQDKLIVGLYRNDKESFLSSNTFAIDSKFGVLIDRGENYKEDMEKPDKKTLAGIQTLIRDMRKTKVPFIIEGDHLQIIKPTKQGLKEIKDYAKEVIDPEPPMTLKDFFGKK